MFNKTVSKSNLTLYEGFNVKNGQTENTATFSIVAYIPKIRLGLFESKMIYEEKKET